MTWQIVFYSRVTGDISRKRGYKRRQAAAFDLRENGFAEDSRIPVGSGWRKTGWRKSERTAAPFP